MSKDPLGNVPDPKLEQTFKLLDSVATAWGLGTDLVQSSEHTKDEIDKAKAFLIRMGFERPRPKARRRDTKGNE